MILLIMYLTCKCIFHKTELPPFILNGFIRRIIIIIGLIILSSALKAQPYYDAAFIRGSISPDAALFSKDQGKVSIFNYVAGLAYPVIFKKDSSKLVVGAFTEHWSVKSNDVKNLPGGVQSLLLPVAFIKPVSKKWSLALSVIPRWNGIRDNMFDNSFQLGGSVLAAFKKTARITYRLGIYYNSEFFGPFIIPLVGIDWSISNKDNLFGILPQILTYEHRVSNRFSFGAVYRMFNNSYRITSDSISNQDAFMRINEMQLLLSADIYLTKRIALNIEAGHSMFRHVRLGLDQNNKNYYSDENVNDGFVVKAGLVYRVRLR
jgi:hypothetical protein